MVGAKLFLKQGDELIELGDVRKFDITFTRAMDEALEHYAEEVFQEQMRGGGDRDPIGLIDVADYPTKK